MNLKKTVKAFLPDLEQVSGDQNPQGINFFRLRRSSTPAQFAKVDLFHIPFEQRYKVAPQRYSVAGIPCLYLAGSLYTCWRELGRPPFHELYGSLFWVKRPDSLKMLNLIFTPQLIGKMMDQIEFSALAAMLALWPLLFSCSIVVKQRSGPFKPEYIIPQMLLHWLVEHDDQFHGILYGSTHVNEISLEHRPFAINFVLPARKIVEDGHCEHLLRVFDWTPPTSWQYLSALNEDDREKSFGESKRLLVKMEDGRFIDYRKTQFHAVERQLERLKRDIQL